MTDPIRARLDVLLANRGAPAMYVALRAVLDRATHCREDDCMCPECDRSRYILEGIAEHLGITE